VSYFLKKTNCSITIRFIGWNLKEEVGQEGWGVDTPNFKTSAFIWSCSSFLCPGWNVWHCLSCFRVKCVLCVVWPFAAFHIFFIQEHLRYKSFDLFWWLNGAC